MPMPSLEPARGIDVKHRMLDVATSIPATLNDEWAS